MVAVLRAGFLFEQEGGHDPEQKRRGGLRAGHEGPEALRGEVFHDRDGAAALPLLTGDCIEAQRACDLGLLAALAEPERLDAQARA